MPRPSSSATSWRSQPTTSRSSRGRPGSASWSPPPLTAHSWRWRSPRASRPCFGLRPRLAQATLVGLVTLAIVSSYQAVGSLLVVGLLIAPAVAAGHWTRRLPSAMVLACVFGVGAVVLGLLLSWHAGTAAGASIALTAILLAAASWAGRGLHDRTQAAQVTYA
ncbi:metal ABC transporter permease [Microbacterium sp. NPDC055455]